MTSVHAAVAMLALAGVRRRRTRARERIAYYGSRLDDSCRDAGLPGGSEDPLFGAKPQFSGNCLPSAPHVKVVRNRVKWRALSNATSYQVWRNGKRVATTTRTSYRGARGHYRVRGVNPLGAGTFG